MIGGNVIETIDCGDKIWINVQGVRSEARSTCAIYVKADDKARTVHAGDRIWWQGGRAFWTPWNTRDNCKVGPVEVVLERKGGSGVSRPFTPGKWYYPADGHLPPAGEYVLVRLTKDNWRDSSDPEGVYFKTAKLEKGISMEARAALPHKDERKRRYVFGDEHGNNQRDYAWSTFGPSSYFGQEVDAWQLIARPSRPRSTACFLS